MSRALESTRIFLVEDQPTLLKSLIKALSSYPELSVVGSSQDGEEAIAAVLAAQPELVLLDLELPSLHGIEVIRRLKPRAPEIEILVLTSFDDEQKVYEAIAAGASGYLVKRVGPEKIRAAIQEVMAGGTVLEPIIARRFWNLFQSVRTAPPPPPPPAGSAPEAASTPTAASGDLWGLTPVETEVLRYLAKGLSNAEVGRVMTLERRTVRTHLSHIYRKMGVHSHVEAVVKALRAGMVEV